MPQHQAADVEILLRSEPLTSLNGGGSIGKWLFKKSVFLREPAIYICFNGAQRHRGQERFVLAVNTGWVGQLLFYVATHGGLWGSASQKAT